MSWSTYSIALTATIEAEGYRRIPENKTIETTATSFNDKSFELKWRGMGNIVQHTSSSMSYENQVLLRVIYTNMDSGQMDANIVLITTLIKAIQSDYNFISFVSEPTVTDLDNKHIVMETTFLYGQEGC